MQPHRLSSDPRVLILTFFYLATFDSARLKSHRRKSGKRGERSTRGSRGSPPRLVADDSVRLGSPILLVGFDSGFGLRAKVTIHSAQDESQELNLLETFL